ncbi:MAG: hypothetical protein ACK5N0_11165 [Synechococcaceae cyanobacterium]
MVRVSILLAMVFLGLDLPGWITLVAGCLLALITLFTGYDHVDIPGFRSIRLDQQIGIPLLIASLATLAGDAQLATRRRSRDQEDRIRAERDRIREQEDRARETDERAQERERLAQRHQLQARALRAAALVQLDPSPLHRRFLELIAAELAASTEEP